MFSSSLMQEKTGERPLNLAAPAPQLAISPTDCRDGDLYDMSAEICGHCFQKITYFFGQEFLSDPVSNNGKPFCSTGVGKGRYCMPRPESTGFRPLQFGGATVLSQAGPRPR